MPHHALLALLTPWGRLPQFTFAALAMGLFIACYILWSMVSARAGHDPFGTPTFALFAVMWMLFCIFTRRFRDLGSSGALMLPVFILASVAVLAKLDPTVLGL